MSTAPKIPLQPMTPQNVDLNNMAVVNPTNLAPVYANNAAVMQMPHDFRLVFSEVISDGPANAPRLELRASVAISPTMLKGLYAAIGSTLVNFEKSQGEIKWPPQPHKTN